MTQRNNRLALDRSTLSALVIVIILAAICTVLAINRLNAQAGAGATPASKQVASAQSAFSFSGATGWTKGPSNETSMALFHGQDCFVAVEYKAGTVDAAAELQSIQDDLVSNEYIFTPVTTQQVTIQTADGPQQYELHQSAVTSPGGTSQLKGGQEFGYLPLAKGYLEIEGYCDTADQLPVTIPALEALRFTQSD
jgi:hypothetical protein